MITHKPHKHGMYGMNGAFSPIDSPSRGSDCLFNRKEGSKGSVGSEMVPWDTLRAPRRSDATGM
jgi:hypothetical protein